MRFTPSLCLSLAGLAACGGAELDAGTSASEVRSAPFNVPGKYVHDPVVGGVARELIVYVPERARGPQPVPVVFMLHGTSGDGEKFFNISGWREQADQDGFIAVFPSALTYCLKEDENADGDFDDRGETKVTTKWAAGNLGNPAIMPLCSAAELDALGPVQRAAADHPLMDDVAFFSAMLDALPVRYAVDTKRVYVSGFSNGGQMSSRLAVELSHRFAAGAAAAGGLAIPAVAAERPMSFVFTVGELDDRFTTPLGVSALPMDPSLFALPSFRGLAGKYLTAFQLAERYTFLAGEIAGARVVDFHFAESTAGASNTFDLAVIEGATHQYPNGINHPIRLASVLWQFFRGQRLP